MGVQIEISIFDVTKCISTSKI